MKKVKSLKGFGIYQRNAKELAEIGLPSEFCIFLPEQSPQQMDYPDWECDSMQECVDWINCY